MAPAPSACSASSGRACPLHAFQSIGMLAWAALQRCVAPGLGQDLTSLLCLISWVHALACCPLLQAVMGDLGLHFANLAACLLACRATIH
jgi:hypothetical protein